MKSGFFAFLNLLLFCVSASAEWSLQPKPTTSPLVVEIGKDTVLHFEIVNSETGQKMTVTSAVQATVDNPGLALISLPHLTGFAPGETVLHAAYNLEGVILQADVALSVQGTTRYEKLILKPTSKNKTGELAAPNEFHLLYGDPLYLKVSAVNNQGKEYSMEIYATAEWDNPNLFRMTSSRLSTTMMFDTLSAGQAVFRVRLGDLLESKPLTVIVHGITGFRLGTGLLELREFDTVNDVYLVYANGKETALRSLYKITSLNDRVVGVNAARSALLAREKGEGAVRFEYSGHQDWFGGTYTQEFPVRVIASVSRIEMDPPSFPNGIPTGQETEIRAMVEYDDGVSISKPASWVYDTKLANMEWNGDCFILKGNNAGATVLYPYFSDHRRVNGPSTPVEFYVPIKSVAISPSPIKVNLNQKTRIVLQVTRTDKSVENRVDGFWTMDSPLGTLSQGDFRAGKTGKATLTCRYTEHGQLYTASASITVEDWIEALEISPSAVEMKAGGVQDFEVYALWASGLREAIHTQTKTKLSLSNTAVGSLAKNVFTAKAAGYCTLKADYGDYTANALITVDNPLQAIEIDPAGSLAASMGQFIDFAATGRLADGSQIGMSGLVDWICHDPSIAQFDGNTLEALQAGTTSITARFQEMESAPTALNVPAELISIEIAPGPFVSLLTGESEVFRAVGVYSDGRREDFTGKVVWETTSFSSAIAMNGNEVVALRGGTAAILARYEDRQSAPVGIWVDRSLETPEISLSTNLLLSGKRFFGPDIVRVECMNRRMLARVNEKGEFQIGRFYLPSGEAQTARLTATGWFNGGCAELDVPVKARTVSTGKLVETRNGKISFVNNVVHPGEVLMMRGVPSIHPDWDTYISETGIRIWRALGISEIALMGTIDPSPSEGNFTLSRSSYQSVWKAPSFKSPVTEQPAGLPPLLDGAFQAGTYISAMIDPQPSRSRYPLWAQGSFLSHQGWGYTTAPYYIEPHNKDYLSLLVDRDWVARGGTLTLKAAYRVPNAVEETATLVFDLPASIRITDIPTGWKYSGNLLSGTIRLIPLGGSSSGNVAVTLQVADDAPETLDFYAYFQETTQFSDPVRVNVEPAFALDIQPIHRSVAAGEKTALTLTAQSAAPLRSARVQISCPPWFEADLSESSSGIEWPGRTAAIRFSIPDSNPVVFTLAGRIHPNTPPSITQLRFMAEGIGVQSQGNAVLASPQETTLFLTPLLMTLKAREKQVDPGEPIHYTLTLTHGAAQAISNLQLEVDIPEGISIESPPPGGVLENQVLKWTLANLPEGRTIKQEFVLKVSDEWSSLLSTVGISVRSRSPEVFSPKVETWITKGAWGMVTTTRSDLFGIDDSYPVSAAKTGVFSGQNEVDSTETDANGIFELRGMIPGDYRLNVETRLQGFGGEWIVNREEEFSIPAFDISPQLRNQSVAIGPVRQLFAPPDDAQVVIPPLRSEFSQAGFQGGIINRFQNRDVVFPGRGILFERTLPGFPNLVSETLNFVAHTNLNDSSILSGNRPLVRQVLGLLAINEINQYNETLILDIADGYTTVLDNAIKMLIVLKGMMPSSGSGDGDFNVELYAAITQEVSKFLSDQISKLAASDASDAESFKRMLSFCLPLIKTPLTLLSGSQEAGKDLFTSIGSEIAKIVLDEWVLSGLVQKNRRQADAIRLADYATRIEGSHDSARRETVNLLRARSYDSDMAHFNYEAIKKSYDHFFTQFTEFCVDLLASKNPKSDFAKFSLVLKGLRSGLVGAAAYNCVRQLHKNTGDLPGIVKTAFQPQGKNLYAAKENRRDVAPYADSPGFPLQVLWDNSAVARQALADALLRENRDDLETGFTAFRTAILPFEQYLEYVIQTLMDTKNLAGSDDERLEIELAGDAYRLEKIALLGMLFQDELDSVARNEVRSALMAFETSAQTAIDTILRYVQNAPNAIDPDSLTVLAVQSARLSANPLTPGQPASLAIEVINRGGKAANNVRCQVEGFSEITAVSSDPATVLEPSQVATFTFDLALSEDAVNGPFLLLATVYSNNQTAASYPVAGTISGANDPGETLVKEWQAHE